MGPLQPHTPLPSGIPVSGEEEEEGEGVEMPLSAALVFTEVWPGGLLNMTAAASCKELACSKTEGHWPFSL